jgi:predicted PurR-regulated permease PerM
MLKNIFTKEMLTNAVVTLGVVMIGLAVHDKFVRPRIMASNNGGATPSPAPAPAPKMDAEA